ncbi:MAG: ribonucleotide-diphosphate reductase subunit beta [Crocosphaera sp.]|nr:ribonucleotide-diphosphate reductase subunit beta [Crocosphaera sp.]
MQAIEVINAVYPNFENSKDNPESYYLLRLMDSYPLELNEEDVFLVS